ncbi:MAG: hypothetical protein AB7I59_04210 [Geminicoccaceae bacterium]
MALALALAFTSLPGHGATSSARDGSVDRFLATSVPVCMRSPAVQCVSRGFAFVDADGDGKLSLTEVESLQAQIDRWAKANSGRLPAAERQRLIIGLMVIQTVGPEQLFTSYDADGDGFLSREEVTADIQLDKRPLPEILADPAAIDWNALAARAGDAAPILKRLFDL